MPSGTYTVITLDGLAEVVGDRLSDSGNIHWTRPELHRYVAEAVRTWNALTSTYRATGVFNTTVGQTFYDIPTVIPSLRAYTVTDADLVDLLAYMLLETLPTGSTWNGTEQFSLEDLTSALARRRDLYLQQTATLYTQADISTAPATQGRLPLDESVITVRRCAWKLSDGRITPMHRDDTWGMNSFHPSWLQTAARPPRIWTVSTTPPLILQVAPIPSDTGEIDLISINRYPTAIDLDNPAPFGIPDDWCWVVLFGALADLLNRDGLALDPARAGYCEARWQQGINLASAAPVVLAGRLNNIPSQPGALEDADRYSPTWQTVPGTPRRLLTAGQNLVATWPPAGVLIGGGTTAVTLEVVRNAPIPAPGGFLQIGEDLVDPLADYAQHLALFKEGAAQLVAAQQLFDRFLAAAGIVAATDQATTPNRGALVGQTTQDIRSSARRLPVAAPAGITGDTLP